MTKVEQEEEAGSYSMNDDANNDYICSNNDHSNEDDNMKQAWGTWEELLLACAVKRHGFCDWDSVSTEVRSRTSVSSAVFFSADNCRHKYQDLKRRFHNGATETAEKEEGGDNIPWLEELRSLRVAELRREVQQYDVSILSLQLKVKKLEEERDGGEKLDLEEERKGERSENDDGGEKTEESGRENRSMNESNSTASGEKTVGEDEPSQSGGDKGDPDPVNTAEEGSEASQSGELGESGTWKGKRRKHSADNKSNHDGKAVEIRSAGSKSQPLIRLLDLIRSHPRGSLFERRVRSQETEDYKSLVKQHLDIETIQIKLKQRFYDSSRLTFYRDLQLLFTNAITFFPSSSSESMAAHELRAIVSEEMRKESGKESPRVLKASAAMTSVKADAAETSEQKSSAPLVACKRRRLVSAKAAKAASPSSSSFSQKEEETKEETVSEENENVETGGRSSKRKANSNTKTSKGKNKQKQAEAKTEKKVVVSADKKKSVADFLKRIKTSSPQKEEKDQKKSSGNGKKESKPKPRELRSNNVGKKKKAEVENTTTTPVKRAPGRPPQKKTVEATATVSGKRGRESGSTGKDNKQPKKRSRR